MSHVFEFLVLVMLRSYIYQLEESTGARDCTGDFEFQATLLTFHVIRLLVM